MLMVGLIFYSVLFWLWPQPFAVPAILLYKSAQVPLESICGCKMGERYVEGRDDIRNLGV